MIHGGLKGHDPVCVVTQVEVDPRDPAFKNPTKPVGPFFTEEEARRRTQEKGEFWIEDSGRGLAPGCSLSRPEAYRGNCCDTSACGGRFVWVVASGGGGISRGGR